MRTMNRKTGLTLVELLVVVLVFGVLLSIFVSPVTSSPKTAEKTRVLANGRSIYLSSYSADIGNLLDSVVEEYYPGSGDDRFETSTAYFRWLMKPLAEGGAEVLQRDFILFAARGVPSASDLSDFDADHNIWSVVTGLTSDSNISDPFLVTRNLNESRLVDWGTDTERKLENVGTGTYRDPFGDETIVVIRVGGGGDIINERLLLWSNLNPNRLENPILEP